MFDSIFNTFEPSVDQDVFIAQIEEIIMETPEASAPSGNQYELYLLLQQLKAGGITFEHFLAQAKQWAQN